MTQMGSHQQKYIHTAPQDPSDPAVPSARLNSAVRTCIITRQSFPKKDLLRFTLADKNTVRPDILQKQPGRGLYVRPERAYLQQAIKKNSFAYAARKHANVPSDLINQVENSLCYKLLQLLKQLKSQDTLLRHCEEAQPTRQCITTYDDINNINNKHITLCFKEECDVCSSVRKNNQLTDIICINDVIATSDLNGFLDIKNAPHLTVLDNATTRNFLDVLKRIQQVQSNIKVKEDKNA